MPELKMRTIRGLNKVSYVAIGILSKKADVYLNMFMNTGVETDEKVQT